MSQRWRSTQTMNEKWTQSTSPVLFEMPWKPFAMASRTKRKIALSLSSCSTNWFIDIQTFIQIEHPRVELREGGSFLFSWLSWAKKKMHPVYLPFQFAMFYDAINGLQGIVHVCRFGGDCVLSVLGRLFAFTVTLLIAKSIDWLAQWQSREVKGV